MAGRQRPSFLKRQKEEARRARANRKREVRQARRLAADAPQDDAGAAVLAEEPVAEESAAGEPEAGADQA